MKNKKTILIGVIVLLLAAVLVFALTRNGGDKTAPAEPAENAESQPVAAAQPEATADPAAAEETDKANTDESAQLIEVEDEVIIYVPEDQGTDGF